MSGARWAFAGLLLAGFAGTPLAAQGRRSVIEWGIHATFTAVDSGPLGVVAGPRAALRSVGGTRLALSMGAGVLGDQASTRGEVALEYLLAPRAAGKLGVYLGGGLAGVAGAGKGGYLLAYLGVERSPGLSSGWAIEAGLGNGYRARIAWHWRRFPVGWRPQR